jgi:hypothetical protein
MASNKPKDVNSVPRSKQLPHDVVLLRRGHYSIGPLRGSSTDCLNNTSALHTGASQSPSSTSAASDHQQQRPPANICIAVDTLYHIPYLTDVVIECETLKHTLSETHHRAFEALRDVFVIMRELTYKHNTNHFSALPISVDLTSLEIISDSTNPLPQVSINLQPFLEKLSVATTISVSDLARLNVEQILSLVIHLLAVAVPSFKEIFMVHNRYLELGNDATSLAVIKSNGKLEFSNAVKSYMFHISSEEATPSSSASIESKASMDASVSMNLKDVICRHCDELAKAQNRESSAVAKGNEQTAEMIYNKLSCILDPREGTY